MVCTFTLLNRAQSTKGSYAVIYVKNLCREQSLCQLIWFSNLINLLGLFSSLPSFSNKYFYSLYFIPHFFFFLLLPSPFQHALLLFLNFFLFHLKTVSVSIVNRDWYFSAKVFEKWKKKFEGYFKYYIFYYLYFFFLLMINFIHFIINNHYYSTIIFYWVVIPHFR